MRIHYLSILALLFIAFIFYSCVEEPTVPSVKTPYSSVRLGNFSSNVGNINIEIDGDKVYSISQKQLTEHFDVVSGARAFVVTDDGGNVLYNGNVTAPSYEEVTLLFDGYSEPGSELNNTFSDFTYSEGVVYLDNGPDSSTEAWVHYIDVISDTPSDTAADAFNVSKSFIARCIDMDDPDADPIDAAEELSFNTVQSVALTSGNKRFLFLFQTNESDVNPTYDTLGVYDVNNLEGGVRHYLFLTGQTEVESLDVVHDIQVPLPVRSK